MRLSLTGLSNRLKTGNIPRQALICQALSSPEALESTPTDETIHPSPGMRMPHFRALKRRQTSKAIEDRSLNHWSKIRWHGSNPRHLFCCSRHNAGVCSMSSRIQVSHLQFNLLNLSAIGHGKFINKLHMGRKLISCYLPI